MDGHPKSAEGDSLHLLPPGRDGGLAAQHTMPAEETRWVQSIRRGDPAIWWHQWSTWGRRRSKTWSFASPTRAGFAKGLRALRQVPTWTRTVEACVAEALFSRRLGMDVW